MCSHTLIDERTFDGAGSYKYYFIVYIFKINYLYINLYKWIYLLKILIEIHLNNKIYTTKINIMHVIVMEVTTGSTT